MKKQYQNPMIDYVNLSEDDILTASSVDLNLDEADWILDWKEI